MKKLIAQLRDFWAQFTSDPKYIHPTERTRRLADRR